MAIFSNAHVLVTLITRKIQNKNFEKSIYRSHYLAKIIKKIKEINTMTITEYSHVYKYTIKFTCILT